LHQTAHPPIPPASGCAARNHLLLTHLQPSQWTSAPLYTYATPSLLSAIDYGYLLLRPSAITAPCPHGSLPSRLSALVALSLQSIFLTQLLVAGAARKHRRMFASARPSQPLCTHRNAPSTPNQDAPPQSFFPTPHTVKSLSLSCRCCRNHCSESAGLRPFTE